MTDLPVVPVCPVCSTPGVACGGHPGLLVLPGVTFTKGQIMALPATKEYDVEVNGITTTLRLNDADARARGLLGDGAATTDLAAAGSAPVGSAPAARDPFASAGALTQEQVDAAEAQRLAEAAEAQATAAKEASTAANKAVRAANKSTSNS